MNQIFFPHISLYISYIYCHWHIISYLPLCFPGYRSSHWRYSVKKGVLKKKNTFKMSFQHKCFPLKFAKFLRAPILKNISERQLLWVTSLTLCNVDLALPLDRGPKLNIHKTYRRRLGRPEDVHSVYILCPRSGRIIGKARSRYLT